VAIVLHVVKAGEGGQGFNRDAWGNTERRDFRSNSGEGAEGGDRPRRSFGDRPRSGGFGGGERRGGFGGGERRGGFGGDRDRGGRGGFGGGERREGRGGFGGGSGGFRGGRGGFGGDRDRGPRREGFSRDGGDFRRRDDRQEGAESAQQSRITLPENSILIMGRNCIQEVMKHNPERMMKLYVGTDQGDARLETMVSEIEAAGVAIERIDRVAINKLCESESHQGVAAAVTERVYQDLEQYVDALPEGQACKLLLLDSISDPQNFGAILRAAECFGMNAVVWSRNRSSGITPTVAKVSCGGSELVTLLPVNNLADAVAKLKTKGFWMYASTTKEGAVPMSEIKFDNRSAVILGSEGYGVQELLLKESDFRFFIPQAGRIDSLNVSQACAVILAKMSGANLVA
jgi:23S rRNA (guanosine2251-2'-O)-methyltransferase